MRKKNKTKHGGVSQNNTQSHVLLKKRRVSLFGDVNEVCEKRVIEALEIFNKENSHKKILLFINSIGGLHESGSNIAKAIRASKAPVYGIVIWSACSAAFDVLQACKKRIACNKNSLIMCHAPSLDGLRVDQLDRDEAIKKMEEEHNDFLYCVVARSDGKLSFEKMRELSIQEVNIHARQARRLGLLDRVMNKKKKKAAYT